MILFGLRGSTLNVLGHSVLEMRIGLGCCDLLRSN